MDLEKLADEVMDRLFVEIEASGRHVHVTKEQAICLFGHPLTEKRPLSQPGQYLSGERVTVRTAAGEIPNVAVLGPERKEAQVEISLTDARALGIQPPVRLSGNVAGTPGAVLVGDHGTVTIPQGVLVAQRHVHLTPEAAAGFGVTDGQRVRLQTFTRRPVLFEDLVVRVNRNFHPNIHLDYDEANACGFRKGDYGRLIP